SFDVRRERELRELVSAFESAELPIAEWHHRDHLAVVCWYVHAIPLDEALARFRGRLQAFNAAHGITQTKDRGYHETVTVFFVKKIAAIVERVASLDELVATATAELG